MSFGLQVPCFVFLVSCFAFRLSGLVIWGLCFVFPVSRSVFRVSCSGFRVASSGSRVSGFGSGFRFPVSRFRVVCSGSGFRFQVLRIPNCVFRVLGRQIWVSDFGFRISGLGFRDSNFGGQISGFGFRVLIFGFWGYWMSAQMSRSISSVATLFLLWGCEITWCTSGLFTHVR